MKGRDSVLTEADPIIPNRRVRVTLFASLGLLLLLLVSDIRIRARHDRADWVVYWTAAHHITEPGDPYRIPAPNRRDYYIYPPLFALLLSPLAALRVDDAVTVWHVVNVALLFGCYVEWRRLHKTTRLDVSPPWLVVTTILVGSFPAVSSMQGGQVNILIFYAALLGCRLVLAKESEWSWFAAGVVLALPAAIKLSPGLIGAVLVFQLLAQGPRGEIRDARRRGLILAMSFAAGSALWLLIVPALMVGWHRNLELLSMFFDHIIFARSNMNAEATANQGIVQAVRLYADQAARFGFEVSGGVVAVITLVLSLSFGIPVAMAIWKLLRKATRFDHVVVFSLAAAASLFYSPVSWHQHFMLATPFLAAAPLQLIDWGRESAARKLAASVLIVFLLQYAVRAGYLLAVPVLGPLFAICVVSFCVVVLRHGAVGPPKLEPMYTGAPRVS